MTDYSRLAAALLGAGLLGTLFVLLYLRLCAWADWGLMTARARRRVALVQRRLPAMAVGSAGVAGVGLLLGLVDVLGAAA
jgi:hypothetical protein